MRFISEIGVFKNTNISETCEARALKICNYAELLYRIYKNKWYNGKISQKK